MVGATAIQHKARGKPPNNPIHRAKRDYVLALVKESYSDFGPTLAAEKLAEHHGFKVSRETLRKWMVEDRTWLSRKQRRTFHQPRLRRECYGELIQIDGSDHRWFEDRGDPCTLLIFVDDATSTLMELRFVKAESTLSYFEALESYLHKHGRPVAFYSDKHTVFRVAKEDAKGGAGMTQFGRALNELNIEILCANSSQAKGRIERANRTLQDQLIKELRRHSAWLVNSWKPMPLSMARSRCAGKASPCPIGSSIWTSALPTPRSRRTNAGGCAGAYQGDAGTSSTKAQGEDQFREDGLQAQWSEPRSATENAP